MSAQASGTVANPLGEGLHLERVPEPCAVVIFGASGDLTRRMLLPALYNLAVDNLLPAGFSVIGFARRQLSQQEFRQQALETVRNFSRRPPDEAVWESFSQGLFYIRGEFGDPESYRRLVDQIAQVDRERGVGANRLFYLAAPPSAYPDIIKGLGSNGLYRSDGEAGWARVIIEKPFGRDLKSAWALNREVAEVFREDQVYRIDHYLGKETVQNIFVFRFANGIFEPVWNRRYIDHVQITVAESIGLEGRAAYYEEAGALRDMVQNHLLQLLSLVAMEPPIAFNADAVRNEKVKVLQAIRPFRGAAVVESIARGQYGPGWVGGKRVPGYREEPGVRPDSGTDTFVALRLFVDNWRWADVPFYLRVGKRLPKRATEIAIQFKRAPLLLFRDIPECGSLESNVLAMRIQPNEGITLKFHAKEPGIGVSLRPVNMDFLYGESFLVEPPSAYETLLLDCLVGDSTLFARWDEVEAAWAFVTEILEAWDTLKTPSFPNYDAGSWGPAEADELIGSDGRQWRRL